MDKRVFISVGDLSASNYISAIFSDSPRGISLSGITDSRMERVGIRSVGRVEDISVVGFTEILPKVLKIRNTFRKAVAELKKTDVLIACDAPGFNLPLIRKARKEGVRKVIYFISPQVWAWKKGRAKTVAEFCDDLILILPFELDIYRRFPDLRVHYVGHPLVDLVRPSAESIAVKDLKGRDVILLMPGSRESELRKHLPFVRSVIDHMSGFSFSFVLPTFENFRIMVEREFSDYPLTILTERDSPTPSYDLMGVSKAGLIASGTASLECALSGLPHGIFYRVSPLTYFLGRMVIKLNSINLPNLIIGKRVVPEWVNQNPARVAGEFLRLIEDDSLREAQKRAFEELRDQLGGRGVIERLRQLFFELISVS